MSVFIEMFIARKNHATELITIENSVYVSDLTLNGIRENGFPRLDKKELADVESYTTRQFRRNCFP